MSWLPEVISDTANENNSLVRHELMQCDLPICCDQSHGNLSAVALAEGLVIGSWRAAVQHKCAGAFSKIEFGATGKGKASACAMGRYHLRDDYVRMPYEASNENMLLTTHSLATLEYKGVAIVPIFCIPSRSPLATRHRVVSHQTLSVLTAHLHQRLNTVFETIELKSGQEYSPP